MQGDHDLADIAEKAGRAILCRSGAFLVDDLMPAGRGPRMRDEPGRSTSLVNDLYVAVIALCSPHVRAPCAPRTANAVAALQGVGVEVYQDKGHDDELDSVVWGTAVCSVQYVVSDASQSANK